MVYFQAYKLFSSRSMTALWTMSEMRRAVELLMPLKFAEEVKASLDAEFFEGVDDDIVV